jgi:serine/threonine protein phosphatase 1
VEFLSGWGSIVAKLLTSATPTQRPRLPNGRRIYAVGDIHGCADLLSDIFDRIDDDLKSRPTPEVVHVFLGDYIDRGPDSRQVIELLIARQRENDVVFLKGNHEIYIMNFLKTPRILDDWQRLGGLETLMSYGINPIINANAAAQARIAIDFDRVLPESHRQFLNHLTLSFTCGDFFFVHAGVRPGVPLERQRDEDLLWIRQEFLLCENDFGKIVVHGHTPVPYPDVRPNRINIDTGAYATRRLTCLVLEGNTIDFI